MTEFSAFSEQPTPAVSRLDSLRKDLLSKRSQALPKPSSRTTSTTTIGKQAQIAPRRNEPTTHNATQRARNVSPASKKKEEMAREIVARAKERKGAALNDVDVWKNIGMVNHEKLADDFRESVLVARCWQIWLQGFQWIVVSGLFRKHKTYYVDLLLNRQQQSKSVKRVINSLFSVTSANGGPSWHHTSNYTSTSATSPIDACFSVSFAIGKVKPLRLARRNGDKTCATR